MNEENISELNIKSNHVHVTYNQLQELSGVGGLSAFRVPVFITFKF
jgi:hypothetical protein